MTHRLRLISHHLCPYVQRAVVVAAEKGIALERRYVDLRNKPDWFLTVSPTGKVPLLQVAETSLFESSVICEYLDEISPGSLHPADALERARHRSWMEFASAILADIGGLYTAPDQAGFEQKRASLAARFGALERVVGAPYFAGESFHMVDAFYGSGFRYFDVIEAETGLRFFTATPRLAAWRRALAARPSIEGAVTADYPERLKAFLLAKNAHLSKLTAACGSDGLLLETA
jgi:glutathione S-transferase